MKSAITILLVAVAYFVAGRLGLMLPAFGSSITLIWLPSGIAVAALLRWGYGCWPGVVLGALTVNLAIGTPWQSVLGIAVGNTLGTLFTVWMLRRMAFHPAFDRARDILVLAAAAVLGMAVNSGIGVGCITAMGLVPPGTHLVAWLTWWAGDAMGVIAGAPLVLTFTRVEVRAILRRRVEFLCWLVATWVTTWAAFVLNRGASPAQGLEVGSTSLPFVAWAALRFGPVGTSLGLILVSVGAAYGTATQSGPFYRADPVREVELLWLFMVTSAALGWLVSAVNSARRQSVGVQRLFEQALSDVSLGVLLAGMDRRITYANQGFTRLTGYTEAELLGKSCAILQGPDSDPVTAERLQAAVHGDGFFDSEILNYRKDGTTFWNALLISPVRDERGVMTGFLGIQRDVTKRKHAEMALHQSEEHLRAIVDLEPECVKLLSPDGKLIEMNPAGLAMIEAESLDQVRGCSIGELIVEESRAAFAEMHRRVIQGETGRCEFAITGLKGARRWMETHAVPYRDARREIVGVLGITRDITERKRAEEERTHLLHSLEESQVRLQTLVGNLPGMAYRCLNNPSWTMSYVSEGCEAVTSYRREELENNRSVAYADLIHVDDREWLWAKCQKSLDARTPCQNEYRILDRHGRERWVSERASGVYGPDGALLAIDGFIQDITAARAAKLEREQLDRKVRETQKLESLGVLAGGIAHDFNNILTTILGNASLASMEMAATSSAQECMTQITEASMRAADLCKQMLAYSGRGRFVVQKLDLGELVDQTAQMLQISISKKAVLRFHLEKGLPPVEVDATQIRQVIMNLVINASEAIGDKSGVISISTGLTRVDRAYFAGTLMDPELPEGEYVFLEVSDTGSGMSPETKEKIFDPFFTTKFTGRGLGLAAVLGIVRGHKGALKLYSEPGRGTTFKLLFPAVSGVGESSSAAPVVADTWTGKGTVLVADDEETMRSTLARMVRKLGMEPVLVSDGREAVEVFRAEPDRFTLVLLDLTMPHMDGEQAFTELRRIRRDVRVVLMSGFNAQEAVVRFTGKGLSSFLQKPFAIDTLKDVLRTVLG